MDYLLADRPYRTVCMLLTNLQQPNFNSSVVVLPSLAAAIAVC